MQENNYIIVDGELYHYGVPGMKWGQKKAALNRKNVSNYKGKDLTVSQASRKANVDKANAKKRSKKTSKSKTSGKKKFLKVASKGARVVRDVAMFGLMDDIFNYGQVRRTGKAIFKQTGRAATEAYLRKHGSLGVTWLD